MQDYFAHCIKISLCVRSGKYYNSNYNKTTYSDRYLTGINNDLKSKYDVPLSAFEDNVNFMPWRVSLAKKITTIFYNRWAINKKINTLIPIVMENKPVTYYKMYNSYYYYFKTFNYDYLLI